MKCFFILIQVVFLFGCTSSNPLPSATSIISIEVGSVVISTSAFSDIIKCFEKSKKTNSPAKWMVSPNNNKLNIKVKGKPTIQVTVYISGEGAFSINNQYYTGLDYKSLKLLIPNLHR